MTSSSPNHSPPPFWQALGVEGLNRGPLYIILGLLFYAPFCFGLREGAGEPGFVTLSFIAFFLFCWQRFLAEQWPRAPLWLLFCFAFIALQGLWMQLNANSYYLWHDVMQTARVLDPAPFPSLPGSRNRIETPMQFHPQLAVFCLMIVVINLNSQNRRLVLSVGALAAATFAVVGLVMKLDLWLGNGDLLHWYWGLNEKNAYTTVFATYRYHGNTATYLAIGLCLNLGLFFQALRTGDVRTRSFAAIGSAVVLAALIVNTSRAGWALTIIVALLFVARLLNQIWKNRDHGGALARGMVMLSVVLLVTGVIFYTFLYSDDGFRQERLSKISESLQSRFQLALFAEMWKDTPWFGFGPGAFASVFPKYQLLHPGHLPMNRFLNEAHQDYFQLLFDWGIPAFACWLVILVLPIVSGWGSRGRDPFSFACQVGGFVVLVHAMMDFPLQVTSLLFYLGLMLACLQAEPPTRSSESGDDG